MFVYCCATSNPRFCETGKPPQVMQWLVLFFFCLGSQLDNLLELSARLQQAIKRPVSQELTANDSRTLIALVNIVSLLAENCNFDTLRKDHSSAYTGSITRRILILCVDLTPDLNNVSQVLSRYFIDL